MTWIEYICVSTNSQHYYLRDFSESFPWKQMLLSSEHWLIIIANNSVHYFNRISSIALKHPYCIALILSFLAYYIILLYCLVISFSSKSTLWIFAQTSIIFKNYSTRPRDTTLLLLSSSPCWIIRSNPFSFPLWYLLITLIATVVGIAITMHIRWKTQKFPPNLFRPISTMRYVNVPGIAAATNPRPIIIPNHFSENSRVM